MKILRLYQIYMEIKGYTRALCYRFVVFSRSSAFSTPELFSFARDGAKGLWSRMAVPRTKWNEEKKVRREGGFFAEHYNESLESVERIKSKCMQCCL